jgi:amino acid transporter
VPVTHPVDQAVVPAGLVPVTSRGKLLQVLGVSFGVAVIIGNTILVGILRTPGDVAAQLPSPVLFLGVWIIGGLYALLGAISLAEPGAMVAESGGQYVFVLRGLGEYPGFVVGWNDWISTCASVSLGAMVFTEYLEPLLPAMAGYAANGIRVNDALLIARGFPATSALLGELGYDVVPLAMSEYRKMDGGLSCLSVRW